MKIAILGAMIEEIEPVLAKIEELPPHSELGYILEHMSHIKLHSIADNRYFEAKYKGVDVVVAYSKIGKVYAALSASVLIQHFKVDRLLF